MKKILDRTKHCNQGTAWSMPLR